jgi:hypothetical protein
MAESKERRKTPRKPAEATPKPDSNASAPRKASMPMGGTATYETSSEETRRRIAEAAYFRAKQRNFEPGHELEDWVEAESEVMGRVNGADR